MLRSFFSRLEIVGFLFLLVVGLVIAAVFVARDVNSGHTLDQLVETYSVNAVFILAMAASFVFLTAAGFRVSHSHWIPSAPEAVRRPLGVSLLVLGLTVPMTLSADWAALFSSQTLPNVGVYPYFLWAAPLQATATWTTICVAVFSLLEIVFEILPTMFRTGK